MKLQVGQEGLRCVWSSAGLWPETWGRYELLLDEFELYHQGDPGEYRERLDARELYLGDPGSYERLEKVVIELFGKRRR